MAIDGGLRDKLAAGTRLVARYKGAEHVAEVMTDEDGKTRYRLADGREFKSPSAAASAVMGGQAANGWRFWSVQGEQSSEASRLDRKPDEAPSERTETAEPRARPQCARCGKQFVGPTQLAHHEANAERLCKPA